jgi:hypothetical protein
MSTPGELLEALGREARARFGNSGQDATRVYRGRSVEELVPQIQRDLGAEAIIVRRREGLTGGMLGFFQHAYVEIEAMPGTPGVDLYDEDPGGAAALEPAPAAETAPAPSVAPPAAQQPAPALEHRPAPPFEPATYAQPQPQAQTQPQAQPEPPAAPAAPGPPASTVQRPMLGYAPNSLSRPAPSSSAPSSASALSGAAAPPPFYTREPAAQSTRAGSAYVTAHLAALARADRAKIPPRPRAPERTVEPTSWSADFSDPGARHELTPAGIPEPFSAPARSTPAPQWAAGERREVAPGSQGRARAGVARSLRRCGIGEELTNELIDAAGAHALALAPRAGLAQAVRATLAQRIPVAPPLPSKGAVIVVVGAGGSGKTSCCATLLGAYRKSSSLSASFATITREPERGELQVIISPYIMKPSAARTPRALRALGRARADGIAVIDTPSVSPSDRTGVRELAKLLSELKPERVLVALPATLGATAAAQLLQALKPLGANSLAVTHADETDQIGVAVEAACRFGLAPEYMLERARAGGWRLRQIAPSALAERVLP